MLQFIFASVGFIIGAYIASIGMAVIERFYRKSLGRPKDGPQWVCRLCKSKLGFFETIPLVGYLSTSGRCRHCGSEIPFGLLSTEIAGGMCGCAIGLLLYQYGLTPYVIAAIYICCALLFCALQEMSFGRLYWITVVCIALGAILASFQARRVLISIAFIIVWLMGWEIVRMYKQSEYKKLKNGMADSKGKAVKGQSIDEVLNSSRKVTPEALMNLGVLSSTLDSLSEVLNQQIYYWMFNPYMIFGLIIFNVFGILGAVSIVLFANVLGVAFKMWKQTIDFKGVGWRLRHEESFTNMPQVIDKSDKSDSRNGTSNAQKSNKPSSVDSKDIKSLNNIWSRKQPSPNIIYIAMVVYGLYISSLLFNFM